MYLTSAFILLEAVGSEWRRMLLERRLARHILPSSRVSICLKGIQKLCNDINLLAAHERGCPTVIVPHSWKRSEKRDLREKEEKEFEEKKCYIISSVVVALFFLILSIDLWRPLINLS